jgi:hypothetical protein
LAAAFSGIQKKIYKFLWKNILESGCLETSVNYVKYKNMCLKIGNCPTESFLFQMTVLQFVLQKGSTICAGHNQAFRLINIF